MLDSILEPIELEFVVSEIIQPVAGRCFETAFGGGGPADGARRDLCPTAPQKTSLRLAQSEFLVALGVAAARRPAHVQREARATERSFLVNDGAAARHADTLSDALRRHRINGGRMRGQPGVRAVRGDDAGRFIGLLCWPLAPRQSFR